MSARSGASWMRSSIHPAEANARISSASVRMRRCCPRMRSFMRSPAGEPVGRREQPLRLQQVRPIDHLAIEARDAHVGRLSESGDDAPRTRDLALARCESCIDRRDLLRMYGELAAEPIAARPRELVHETWGVAKIRMYAVDRGHTGGRRREQTQRAGELEYGRHRAVRLDSRAHAERGAEVLRAPREPHEPRGARGEPLDRKHGTRCFRRNDEHADRSGAQPLALLERREIVVCLHELLRSRDLRQHDSIGRAARDRRQVLEQIAARWSVDTYPEPLRTGIRTPLREQGRDTLARDIAPRRRDRILQIENQCVRAALERAQLLALAVARDEEPRA